MPDTERLGRTFVACLPTAHGSLGWHRLVAPSEKQTLYSSFRKKFYGSVSSFDTNSLEVKLEKLFMVACLRSLMLPCKKDLAEYANFI